MGRLVLVGELIGCETVDVAEGCLVTCRAMTSLHSLVRIHRLV